MPNKMMMPTSTELSEDTRQRFQLLKESELTKKYQCPDYAGDSMAQLSTSAHDEKFTLDLRLNRVLSIREKFLRELYDRGTDKAVMSTTAILFDRYLSKVVPDYVDGLAELPYRVDVIGVASVIIAAKSLLARWDFAPTIERFLRGSAHSRDVLAAELDVLTKLNWDVVYPSPVSIVSDLLNLLPLACGYQEHDDALGGFKKTVLNNASHSTLLAAVTYGFTIKFTPLTIALAALLLALEDQCASTDVAIFNLMRPTAYFNLLFELLKLGVSFQDEGVKQCRGWMLHVFENSPSGDTALKTRCPSPTKVTDIVHDTNYVVPGLS